MLRLPSFFQSGMILQQQVPFKVRGIAKPSVPVRIQLRREPFDNRPVSPLDQQYGLVFDEEVEADASGLFEMAVPAPEASFDPHELTVQTPSKSIRLTDVLFGEVWITGGQSNMQMPLSAVQSQSEIETMANLFYVRVLTQSLTGIGRKMPHYQYHPADDICEAQWLRGDQPEDMADISAIAFSFARSLHLSLQIPVAVVETALGGSCIHAWISRQSIDADEQLRQHVIDMGFYRSENDWDLSRDWENAQYQPAALYNNKIAPLRAMIAKGVLWYQGESDYQYPEYYKTALPALVSDWQSVFRPSGSRDLAFLIVQLAPYYYGHRHFYQLAEFNEMLTSVKHQLNNPSALIPVYDLPLDYENAPEEWRHPLHPTAKTVIGQRLAKTACGLLYQQKAPLSAPECSNIEIVGNKMLLTFSHVGEGLRQKDQDGRLRGFTICGPDRVFLEAEARILYGVRVMVWNDQIDDPQAVAYAFSDMNQESNLISRDNLPVVPFRSDRFQAHYQAPIEWLHCESLNIWCSPKLEQMHQTGWHPRWRIDRGAGDLVVEWANKTEGAGSLHFTYQTDEQNQVSLEPVLTYASQFPPLNLSHITHISVNLFNPNQQMKRVSIALAAGSDKQTLQDVQKPVVLVSALRWQTITFPITHIESKDQVHRLVLVIEDRKGKGDLYIDQFELICRDG